MSDLDLTGARTVLAWATSDRLDEIAAHACGASSAAETAFAALRVALAEVDRLTVYIEAETAKAHVIVVDLAAAQERAERAEAERDARPDIATLPTEYACGEWIMSGQAEPDAVVTYASEPSPETGHEGWCWWARGKMGEAKDYMAAREAAERSLRAHAKSGGSDD